MELTATDRKKLLLQLDRLGEAIEELLLTGLTTASETTRQTLGVTFQEATRLRLLRLSGTLRIANEELGRFTRNDPAFSQRRLIFFLNRAWLLGKGIARAVRNESDAELQQLLWTPPQKPISTLKVVTLGVVKKVATGAFCAFEFRLRSLDDGKPFVWSTVFPAKPGIDVPPEGYLQIPQQQKFNAQLFLDRRIITIEQAGVSEDAQGVGRIQLGERSTVTTGDAFAEWERFLAWDHAKAVDRVKRHQPGPFDLEVELQEEIVLNDWESAPPRETDEGWSVTPIIYRGIEFDARIADGIEGDAARAALAELAQQSPRPPLFGVMHYESCRLVLQPLSVLKADGPEYLTISKEVIDRKKLLQALKFT